MAAGAKWPQALNLQNGRRVAGHRTAGPPGRRADLAAGTTHQPQADRIIKQRPGRRSPESNGARAYHGGRRPLNRGAG